MSKQGGDNDLRPTLAVLRVEDDENSPEHMNEVGHAFVLGDGEFHVHIKEGAAHGTLRVVSRDLLDAEKTRPKLEPKMAPKL